MKLVHNSSDTKEKSLAIICADIFEYSKRMNEDHISTHNTLKERFSIIEEVVAKNEGKIVRSQGDSLLITFNKIRNAIYCATEIQTASYEHNFKLSLAKELLFRIGVSYGNVICEDNEPFGEAVNTAKRLEELAPPGGIYISNQALDSLEMSMPFPINYRGKIRVKNVRDPIHVQELSQYKPFSIKEQNNKFLKHPIDRSYLGSFSLLILAFSVIILALSIIVLIYTIVSS